MLLKIQFGLFRMLRPCLRTALVTFLESLPLGFIKVGL